MNRFHGCSFLQGFPLWQDLYTEQLWDIFVLCCDSGSDHCPLGSETWHWTLKGQAPPRQLPPPASGLMIQPQPEVRSPRLPSPPFYPSFPSSPQSLPLTPSLPLSLIFSLCRLSVLPRAPCVTRIIKTNTDLIFVSNPIVLFFSSHRPCSMLGIRCPQPHCTPTGTVLRFQTVRSVTYGGQRVNKALAKTIHLPL